MEASALSRLPSKPGVLPMLPRDHVESMHSRLLGSLGTKNCSQKLTKKSSKDLKPSFLHICMQI